MNLCIHSVDGAEGYVEDGREIFDDDLDEESIRKSRNAKKHNRSSGSKNTEGRKGNIEQMLAHMPAKRKREVNNLRRSRTN